MKIAGLAGLSILVIGASHLATPGYLITSLHDRLLQSGAKVHSIGVCGATPGAWVTGEGSDCGGAERIDRGAMKISVGRTARTQPLEALVRAERPQLLVIVLGDTIAGYQDSYFPMNWASQQVAMVTSTVEALAIPCVWVGPSWGQNGGAYGKSNERVQMVSDFLARRVKPCSYINSLNFSRPGEWSTLDGQHLAPLGYKMWGDGIVREIEKAKSGSH